MTRLPGETWWRFGIWMALGMVFYAAYGFRKSRLRTESAA
jgi:APA family basic amino acid/polyamine antiporter